MRSQAGRALYLYWNEVRAGRVAPQRFEIEPSRFSAFLPDTFILERVSPTSLRFRLAGTRMVSAFDMEFRGGNFLDLFASADHPAVTSSMNSVARHGSVAQFTLETKGSAGTGLTFECIVMPLQHRGTAIDRFLGTLAPLDPPEWIDTVKFVPDRLVDHILIWPDSKPKSLMTDSPRQAPFGPHIRHSKIVRFDRRQFRVYDGGLADSAPTPSNVKPLRTD